MIRTYTVLITLPTYEERLKYLQLGQTVSELTFGGHRYLNQMLYTSPEWRRARRDVIIRDNGCDLGLADRPIVGGKLMIHHIEPITVADIMERNKCVFDPENLICVSFDTHNLIHYGKASPAPPTVTERKPFDTMPWKLEVNEPCSNGEKQLLIQRKGL